MHALPCRACILTLLKLPYHSYKLITGCAMVEVHLPVTHAVKGYGNESIF